MRGFTTTFVLLAALLIVSLANPIAFAKLNDIERRWAEGESEVCVPKLSGCYVLAWMRSLARSSIHAAHSYRDATPAWPVARESLDELSWDERSAAVRHHKRGAPGDVSKLKAFAATFYRKMGMNHRAKQVSDMPLRKPKRGVKYQFAA